MFDATTYLNVDSEEMKAKSPFKMMTPEECTLGILRGVERNQAIITTPLFVRVLWWLYRLSPALAAQGGKYMLKDFRQSRDKFLSKIPSLKG
jgi:short-subunit dehydrogenase